MTVRLGVVGLGTVWARPGSQAGPYATMSDALQREGLLQVTAVHDIDRAKQEWVAGHWDVPADVASWRDLVEDDGVDAVLVLTSMREHGEIATAALRAGKHVLVEKPMATTLAEAERLLEAGGRRAGRPGLRAAHPALADVPRRCTRASRAARSAARSRPAPATAGPARTGRRGSTSTAAAPCSTSASTTSPPCAACSARRGG